MGYSITYRPLCSINIWHGYYLHGAHRAGNVLTTVQQIETITNPEILKSYTILNDLELQPTAESMPVMKNYRIISRQVPTGLQLYIESTPEGSSYIPFIPLHNAAEVLRFIITVKNPSFYNFTNLDQSRMKRNYLFFSNKVNNRDGLTGTRFLNPLEPPHIPHYVTNENSRWIEKDSVNISQQHTNMIGFVDITLDSAALGDYALANTEQVLQAPVYTLWWQNRMTFWRYIFNQNQQEPTSDSDVVIENNNPKQLVSRGALPLIHNNRSVMFMTGGGEVLLPNPADTAIFPEGPHTFSEIYMGDTILN